MNIYVMDKEILRVEFQDTEVKNRLFLKCLDRVEEICDIKKQTDTEYTLLLKDFNPKEDSTIQLAQKIDMVREIFMGDVLSEKNPTKDVKECPFFTFTQENIKEE